MTKSPDRLDLANRFLYIGSMHGEVPMMLAIVAVGAIASTLELRIPWAAIFVPQRRPIHPTAALHLDRLAALGGEQLHGVLRQQPAVPLRARVGVVGAALGRQIDDAS